ncbi:MAG: GGDEF domain-containing protein [Gammaproteobacteria bacterium]
MRTSSEQVATIADLKDKADNENSRQMISYPEHMTDVSEISVHIMGVLQSTLELEKLIELFDDEMSSIVPHAHLAYSNHAEDIAINIGNPAKHVVNYRLALFGHDLGELTVSRDSKLLDNEIEKMENLISALIYPLRNALLYKQAIEKAYIDPLTGVSNRAAFDKALEQECDLAQRHDNALTLMMLDIDRFKEINDNYGHVVGDVALKSFADCISECVRRSDAMFRYGGEEFAIILRNTELDGAALLAERMRKKIEDMQLQYESVQLSFTVSIGVAPFIKGENSQHLVERADKLLYQAKQAGRNCIRAE